MSVLDKKGRKLQCGFSGGGSAVLILEILPSGGANVVIELGLATAAELRDELALACRRAEEWLLKDCKKAHKRSNS